MGELRGWVIVTAMDECAVRQTRGCRSEHAQVVLRAGVRHIVLLCGVNGE